MFEQDIELTRLLLNKLTELDARGEQLRGEIGECQGRLDESQSVRAEREQYLDVLARAAQLLERTDLTVDSPEISALELKMSELTDGLEALDQEMLQYRKLVDELRERAPDLLAAAREGGPPAAVEPEEEPEYAPLEPVEEEPPADEEFEPEEEPESPFAEAAVEPEEEVEEFEEAEEAEPSPAPVAIAEPEPIAAEEESEIEFEPEPEPEAEIEAVAEFESEPEPAAEAEAEPEPAAEPEGPVEIELQEELAPQTNGGEIGAPAAYERSMALDQLFDVKDLKVKEAFTYGLGAAYIVDATSVLDRVPNYDQHFRALQENQVRDELIGDLDRLSREISGDFYVVFISPHEISVPFGTHVFVQHPDGDGSKEAASMHIVQLVKNITSEDRVVCVVTGDTVLAENVSDTKVHVIPLGEFFNT